MKRYLLLVLFLLSSLPCQAQGSRISSSNIATSSTLNITTGVGVEEITNASSTGTTTKFLVTLTGAPATAVVVSTQLIGIEGICVANCGTTGNARIAISGQTLCTFDNTTVAKDYVQANGIDGRCHDAGATFPNGNDVVGQVMDSGAAGDHTVLVYGPGSKDQTGGTGVLPTMNAASQGKWLSNNGTAAGAAWSGPSLDCTQFAGADMSVKIQACTAALSAITTLYGIADARGFVGAQTWSVNPLGGTHPNGGILLLGGVAISQNVPFVKPANWTLQGPLGQNNTPGFHGATITASGSFQTTYSTGTVTVTGTAVTGSGTTWTSNMIGCNFAAGTAITAGTTSSWGVITAVGSTTGLTLGYQGAGNSSAGTAYAIYCPQAQFGNGANGNNEQSGGLDHVDFDCNSVAGCINVGEYFGEEGSFIRNVIMRGTTNIGLDMESSFIQNFGPIEDIGFGCGSGATSATLMAVIRGAAGSARPLRGFSGQCSAAAIGFDVGEWGAILEDMHFENTAIAIEVAGKPACPVACFVPDNSAANAFFKNIWGAGTGTTLIHLSNTIGESNIVLENIGLPTGSGYTNTLVDTGNSCTATTHIGLYSVNNAGKIGYSTIASPLTCLPNGGVPTLLTCGTTTTCSNTIINAATTRIITGRVTLSVGTATVSSISPVFASTTSMKCWASDTTTPGTAATAVPASTSSVTVTGTTTDVIDWGCAGD